MKKVRRVLRVARRQHYRTGLLAFDPGLPPANCRVVEVANLRRSEGPAKHAYPFLPFPIAYHRQTIDIREMPGIELDVVPQRGAKPAVKANHLEQNVDFPVQFDEPIERRYKVLVVLVRQLAAHLHFEHLAAVRFIQPYCHSYFPFREVSARDLRLHPYTLFFTPRN